MHAPLRKAMYAEDRRDREPTFTDVEILCRRLCPWPIRQAMKASIQELYGERAEEIFEQINLLLEYESDRKIAAAVQLLPLVEADVLHLLAPIYQKSAECRYQECKDMLMGDDLDRVIADRQVMNVYMESGKWKEVVRVGAALFGFIESKTR